MKPLSDSYFMFNDLYKSRYNTEVPRGHRYLERSLVYDDFVYTGFFDVDVVQKYHKKMIDSNLALSLFILIGLHWTCGFRFVPDHDILNLIITFIVSAWPCAIAIAKVHRRVNKRQI